MVQKNILSKKSDSFVIHMYLFIYLWLQFLSINNPGLGVKVLAYKYIKLNYEMFEDCHN